MLHRQQIKDVSSLRMKKFRDSQRLFLAEGEKLVNELLESRFQIAGLYASSSWIVANLTLINREKTPVFETAPHEMERMTALATPSPVLAVVRIPESPALLSSTAIGRSDALGTLLLSLLNGPSSGLLLALDGISDPGNLGTIVRIADWFGITTIFCSENTVELYNPKVVQATMGSIARVEVHYCILKTLLEACPGRIPVYGAFLEGNDIHQEDLSAGGLLLIGNESRGISESLEPWVTQKIRIPSYGNSPFGKAESLNASTATAILCAEFRRVMNLEK